MGVRGSCFRVNVVSPVEVLIVVVVVVVVVVEFRGRISMDDALIAECS
jgi:hypothetical protein